MGVVAVSPFFLSSFLFAICHFVGLPEVIKDRVKPTFFSPSLYILLLASRYPSTKLSHSSNLDFSPSKSRGVLILTNPSEVRAVVGSVDMSNGSKRGKGGGVGSFVVCSGSAYLSSDSASESSDSSSGVGTFGGNGHSDFSVCWAVLLLLVLGFCVSK